MLGLDPQTGSLLMEGLHIGLISYSLVLASKAAFFFLAVACLAFLVYADPLNLTKIYYCLTYRTTNRQFYFGLGLQRELTDSTLDLARSVVG